MKYSDYHYRLENLRAEEPIIWAMVLGRTTTASISVLLGWHPDKTQREIDEHHRLKEIKQHFGVAWVFNKHNDLTPMRLQLKEMATKIQLKILEANPQSPELKYMISNTVREEGKAEGLNVRRRPTGGDGLTDKQRGTIELAIEKFGYSEFTALQLAQAKGFSRTGWTKQEIDALEKKGKLIRATPVGARGGRWRVAQ